MASAKNFMRMAFPFFLVVRQISFRRERHVKTP
jgi:hypothetical protein